MPVPQEAMRPVYRPCSRGLKLIFLIVTRAVSLLGLSRREEWWKDFSTPETRRSV
jgi:hypothetical protein